MAAFDFLCIFLCDVVPEGAMVFAPDAPDTVSVEPPALGLLMPVPPCPPAAPPPPAPCAYAAPEIPINNAEIKIPFVELRMVVSSSAERSLAPEGVSPRTACRNSHAANPATVLCLRTAPKSANQPTISTEVPDESLFVAANLAQPGKVEVSVGMCRVKFYASLIGCCRGVIAFQFVENYRAVEVQ